MYNICTAEAAQLLSLGKFDLELANACLSSVMANRERIHRLTLQQAIMSPLLNKLHLLPQQEAPHPVAGTSEEAFS